MADLESTVDARDAGFELTLSPGTMPDETTEESDDLEPGSQIGRYIVVRALGAGAMGRVYLAHDPELDRKVALKLLKTQVADRDSARTRLQREARALAKLDHRNVVSVYDVGTFGQQLFLAMEFVEGQTLTAWMRTSDTPRPWREVIRVFTEAGRGLAAAHAVGLVHRDFKPDNVMISVDERVRVMDFGLARAALGENIDVRASFDDLRVTRPQNFLETLTQTGAVLGTPAYMAPELFAGSPADAYSDQFGFCVALFEALYGQRPFRSATLPELIAAIEAGQISPVAAKPIVPKSIRKIVLRGLATAPEQRWVSMCALIDALSATTESRRSIWLGTSVGLAIVALSAGVVALRQPAPLTHCQSQSDRVHAVWTTARIEALATAHATAGALGEVTWPYLQTELERWLTVWTTVDQDLCQRYGAGSAPELRTHQLLCLDRALEDFRIALDVLDSASPEELEQSFEVVMQLPQPDSCREPKITKTKDESQDFTELGTSVSRLEYEARLGRFDLTDQAAAELMNKTGESGLEALHVRLAILRSDALLKMERYDDAIDSAFSGLAAAEREGSMDLRLQAFIQLINIHTVTQDLRGAQRWLTQAHALATEGDLPRHRVRELADKEAWVLAMDGRLPEAMEMFDRALALADPMIEPLEHASLVVARAQTLNWLGEHGQALEQFELGMREFVSVIGPSHPTVLDLRNVRARILFGRGQLQLARDELLAIAEALDRIRGTSSRVSVVARAEAAFALDRLGNCEDAVKEFDSLLDDARALLPFPSPDLGKVLSDRAKICNFGTPAAIQFADEALELYREAVGDQHVMTAHARYNVARAYYTAGQYKPAREQVDIALAIFAAIAPIGEEFVSSTRELEQLIAKGETPYNERTTSANPTVR